MTKREANEMSAIEETHGPRRATGSPFRAHGARNLFFGASLIIASIQLVPELFGPGKGKDYPLWYDVGRRVVNGDALYANFDFIYPPFAAVLMTPLSLFGRSVSVVGFVLIELASWWAATKLSDRLSGEIGAKPWWLVALPSLLAMPFIVDTVNLGQPNLMLLAMMLAGLALLQDGRQGAAGAMFALATSLKAFPVTVFPYLLWRRRWRAAASMVVCSVAFLLLVPAPIRGFDRNLHEVETWLDGMILSASEAGFGQRPEQNWSWRNNSIIAVTHRLVRRIGAEQIDPPAKPVYVNVLDLSYGQANFVLVAIAGLIGASFCAALPRENRRTRKSDASEFALLLSLMTIASPLARVYYFVWLLFPFTVLAYRAFLDPSPRTRQISAGVLAFAMAVFALTPFCWLFGREHWPQALGSFFWATCVVAAALAWQLQDSTAPAQRLGQPPA
jgi:alpha-1,2-mannosyltransferase